MTITVASRRALLGPLDFPTPILVSTTEKFGRFTYPDVGGGQTDLAQTLGVFMPPGTQEWQIGDGTNGGAAPTAVGGGSITDFVYNSGASNPRTIAGYRAGNTGQTPYVAVFPNTTTGIGGAVGTYTWQYRCRVNGGPWSNWVTFTRTIDASGCNIGDTTGNYASALFYFYTSGAQAYTKGIRTIYMPPGLSRPDILMGNQFDFANGTGWSKSAMMKLMWANNQRCPTLSAISWAGGGLWVDLEYDGVTVTGGRLYGNNQNVQAKIQLSGGNNRVTRCNLMNSENDFTAEHTGSALNVWTGISCTGDNNEVGYMPGGATDYSYANYVSHTFYGIYVQTGSGNTVVGNIVWDSHGRHIGRNRDTTNSIVRYNIVGPLWRTRYPTQDVDNHLDNIWSNDSFGVVVEQNPTIENNIILNCSGTGGANASSGRMLVLGSTGSTLDIATPKVRGNLIIGPYTYGIELGRWSGQCTFTYNTLILAISGDYSNDLEPPDLGGAASRIICQPTSVVAAATMLSDKNFLWNTRDYSAGVLAVTTGTDVQNARGTPTNFLGGVNPKTILEAAGQSQFAMPTKSSEISSLTSYLFTTCARTDGTGAINSTGTAWETLP